MMHVLLELANRLGTEGVRNSLTLPRVLRSVACVEKAPLNADEGVVIVTVDD